MLRPATPFETYARHPLEAIGATLVWSIFRVLPLNWASALGGWLARSIGPKLRLNRRADRNIRRAFLGIQDDAVNKIIHGMWDNLGRTVAEFPHLSSFKFDGDNPRIHINGHAHLMSFRDDDKPGFFVSAHIGNWELAPLTAFAHDVPSVFVYREANNRLVEKLYMRGRSLYKNMMIPKGVEGAKQTIKALKDGKHIGVMIDQKMNDGIPVPFFGIEAMTAPAVAQMALRFNCPILPARVIREQGARFRVDISEPIYAKDTGNKIDDTKQFMTEINTIVEGWVREHPDQWLWLHNRWPDA